MASSLKDKVAIVTGSSSGIGEAIALAFATRGANVTLCGRDPERLKSVLDTVVEVSGGHTDRFLTMKGDLTDSGVRKDIIEKTIEKFGRVDTLVANAGQAGMQGSIHNATEESYDAVMNTNVKSVFFLIQQAIPHLEKSKGNIVVISSNVTSMMMPFGAVYSISKAALDHLTRCLAVDLGQKGIRVNGVNPGYIPTRLSRALGENKAIIDKIGELDASKTPLKGRSLTVEDIAKAVVFLSSDDAGFITGENIKVDGGRTFSGAVDNLPNH
ncbi:unnamed protein product [Candidula unifasciata]|uniref:Uncharacterized protein n=1 Tax=Candidula unifasciata TaxID=100452 RepID=A0A8S3ZTI1_9EUPU|nr:unnamed protein product [Candidula unifasciata]